MQGDGVYMVKKIIIILIFTVILIFSGCAAEDYEEPAEEKTGSFGFTPVVRLFEQTPVLRRPTPEEAEKYPKLTNLPTLYIELEHTLLRRLEREYRPGMYTFVYSEDSGLYGEHLTIKRRGAWSYSHPKAPYTVELLRDTGWGGLPPASKWVLIANWTDKSLLRNYITLKLAGWLTDDFTPDCFFADLVVNGDYRGTYLITESIEIHENRLDLNRETEAVFEIEAVYRHGEHSECINISGGDNHILYKRPAGSITSEHRARNLEKFRTFFEEMQFSLLRGYEAYSEYIDVDSFINWYIVNELTKNFDSAFTASCHCFLKDGKLHMGPSWDFDTPYGSQDIGPPVNKLNPEGFHVSSSPWFRLLTRDETFSRLLSERWTELRDMGVFDDFIKMIDETAVYIAESAALNFEVWQDALEFTMRPRRVSRYTHEGEIEYVRDWAAARINWFDSEWYKK